MFASLDDVEARARAHWAPPRKLSLSQWAEENFYLSAESSAVTGRWHAYPFQVGIMDAVTDPRITQVSVQKSARVGYTKCLNAAIGYFIAHQPSSMLLVQPTVDDAKGYSKEELAPMLRDVPVLSKIVIEEAEDAGPRDPGNTTLHKKFPGGVLSLIGANSGTGFRRITRRVVLFDEVDGYPPSAGQDGDPIALGIKRTETFYDRKIVAGSTPLVAGLSRIEGLFKQGDQRRFYVPCPHCGHFDYLVFSPTADRVGHYMQFDPVAPEGAHFVCSLNGCVIEHHEKREMVARGEWRASAPFTGHASFHVWAAYSFSPNASWGQIATEFVAANKAGADQLKTFINTVLGETWKEQGDAPDWKRLYERREKYAIGSVPEGVQLITGGVDVQKGRWVYEIVGWGLGKESWSIDAGEIPGDTGSEDDWNKLMDELLERTYDGMPIRMLGVDSGYQTQKVYNWARRKPLSRVIATKGVASLHVLLTTPTGVDVTHNGKKLHRGYKMWPIGIDVAKSELSGALKLDKLTDPDAPFPAGYCHFPEYGEEFFLQITSEHLITETNKKTRHTTHEWRVIPGRQNHWLDARVIARAAASLCGLDRLVGKPAPIQAPAPQVEAAPTPSRFQIQPKSARPGGWLSRRR